MWVDEASSGSTITLRVGDALQLRLRAAPSAGYEWELGDEPAPALRFEGPPQIESAEPARRGAHVDQVFRFAAQRAGTTPLSLVYRRPFERDRPPVRTFQIEVRVLPRDAGEE